MAEKMNVDRREFVKKSAAAAGVVAATTTAISQAQASPVVFDDANNRFEYWQMTGVDDSSGTYSVYRWKNRETGETAETLGTCENLRAWVGNKKPEVRCIASCGV